MIIIFSNCFIISSTWPPAIQPPPKRTPLHSVPHSFLGTHLSPQERFDLQFTNIWTAVQAQTVWFENSVCGKECFVSFQRNVKLNIESHITILWVLEVTGIMDCTADATCLMMLALCSTGFFCSTFIFIPVQRHSGSTYWKHLLCEDRAHVLFSLSVWPGPRKGKQGVSAFTCWIALYCLSALTLVLNLVQIGSRTGSDNGYQVLSIAGAGVIRSYLNHLLWLQKA